MKKKWRLLSALVALSLLLTACGGGSGEKKEGEKTGTETSEAAGKTEGKAEGKDTLTVATVSEASSLDPVAQNEIPAINCMSQIFEGLIEMSKDGKLLPKLAEKWEVEGNQKFTFHLRKGVKFHNGDEMTSEDVKYSLTRAHDAAAVAQYFGGIKLDTIQTPDPYTISFEIESPNSTFISYMTHAGGYIINKKAAEASGDKLGVEPCGTGPFKFESWTKNDKLVLTRFDEYWGEKPAFKTLVMRPITEQPQRAIELETGNVDIAQEVGPLDVQRLEQDPNLKIVRQPINTITYLGFNLTNKVLGNVKVREAIKAALPIDEMVKSVYKGAGDVAGGYVPSAMKYSTAKDHMPGPQDLEKAKALLKEAGYPDGFEIRIMTNENPARKDLATIIKAELEKLGIKVTISNLEWTTFLETLKTNDYDMYLLGWANGINDPDVALYPLLNSNASKDGSNYTHFENKDFDALLEKGRLLEDGPEREKVYKDAQDILYKEIPFIPLAETTYIFGLQKDIEGFNPLPFGFYRLNTVTFGAPAAK